MTQNLNRKTHNGKNSYEKEAYKNFLSKKFKLDKTEEDEENLSKTDSSNFNSDNFDNEKIRKKSIKLKITDFFENNWVVGVGTGLIVALIIGGFTFFVRQSVQAEKINNLELGIQKTDNKLEQLTSSISSVKENLQIINTSLNKDIQYIKEKIAK